MRTRIILIILAASLGLAATANARYYVPHPDPSPRAHGKPIVMLPGCPAVPTNGNRVWVEGFEHGIVICAGFQGGRSRLEIHRLWAITERS